MWILCVDLGVAFLLLIISKGFDNMKDEVKVPHLCTIRQTAKLGLISEYALRMMEKSGKLPSIKVGNRVLVNVDKLIEQINDL